MHSTINRREPATTTHATTLTSAVQGLIEAAPHAEKIILFGSQARGDADAGSDWDWDWDFLIIEPEVANRAREMVRLRRALRPLRVTADVLVYSRDEVQRWSNQPGTALYWAMKEGQVVYG